MECRYRKYAYLDSTVQFVLDVMQITGWSENYALARAGSSAAYKAIKKNYRTLSRDDLLSMARKYVEGEGSASGEPCWVNESSEMLHFKLFCFESYMEAKKMTEEEAVQLFVMYGVGTYLETCYSLIKTDNHINVVVDIDIYIRARKKAQEFEL